MIATWRMIPRYCPQIRIGNLLRFLWRKPVDLPIEMGPREPLKEGSSFFALNGATSALHVALKALSLPPGSGVGVPVYACVTVFEAVASAGLSCVFVDVNPETFSFDMESLRRKSGEMAAVIMIHTFGFPGDFEAVKNVMQDRPIIEDCTHALGSSANGRQVGLQGAGSAFSFNYHKPMSVGGGGVLVVNDPQLIPTVQRIIQESGRPRRRPSVKTILKRALRVSLYRPPWYGLMVATGLLKLHRDGALEAQVQVGPMDNFDRSLVLSGLKQMESRLVRQRAWARELCEICGHMQPASRFVELGDNWNGYLWPVLLETPEQRDQSLSFFHRHGVDAFVLWPECLQTASRYGYRSGDCPYLEDALRRLLLLPCYAELTASQRRRITQVVQQWIRRDR